MELYANIWTVIESLGFLFVIFIFFKDPIRRWNFFGYRPTAITVLFDPDEKQILIAKTREIWSFNQGGIYDSNINATVKEVLSRELGLKDSDVRLIDVDSLGTLAWNGPNRLQRARLNTVSLFSRLRGKGYLACFVRYRKADVEQQVSAGEGVDQVKFVSIEEAKKYFAEIPKERFDAGKNAMLNEILKQVAVLFDSSKH